MRILYDITVRIYRMGILVSSLWNRKAKLWIGGRKDWYRNLKQTFGEKERVIWFHCASLGEFEQGRPVMEETRKRFPRHRILLTFFSPSGYEKRKNYEGADHVMYLPLDTAKNASRMINALSLEMAIFVKYEFWYHYLHRLGKEKIPVYLISGSFRPDQLFFKWYGSWYKKFLECFTHIFVQQESSKMLLEKAGIHPVSVAGDTRFDRVGKVAGSEFSRPALEAFASGYEVIIAGSVWEQDEQILVHAFRELPGEVRWIIAPHELSKGHLNRVSRDFSPSVRYTEMGDRVPEGIRTVIIDTIGQLSYLYRYGTLAYIGGGFGKGIHNILEAAAHGLPVIFGPRYKKFTEAVDLVRLDGAFPVSHHAKLLSTIRQQLGNPELLKTSSEVARKYIQAKKGATSVIMEQVCKEFQETKNTTGISTFS